MSKVNKLGICKKSKLPPQKSLSIKLHKQPASPQTKIIFTENPICFVFALYSKYPDRKI